MITNINVILREIEVEEDERSKNIKKLEEKIKKSKKRVDDAISGLSLIL